MKLSWVHSTAIGGVTPALAAPMHLALRVKIFPPFLVVFTPNGLYPKSTSRTWEVIVSRPMLLMFRVVSGGLSVLVTTCSVLSPAGEMVKMLPLLVSCNGAF